MGSRRPTTLRRRDVLALSSVAAGTTLGGCVGDAGSQLSGMLRDVPERQVPPDWHPPPGQWPMRGYGYARTNHNPYASPPRAEPTAAWRHDADADVTDLVVAADAVFVRTKAALVALDVADGTERWRQSRQAGGRLAFVADRLYDVDRDTIRALTPAGDEVWVARLDEWYHSVLERNGLVYALSDRYVTRLHADTGAVVAQDRFSAYALTTMGGPVYAGMFTMAAYDVDDRGTGSFDARWRVEFDGEYRPYGPLSASNGRLIRAERATPHSREPIARLSVYDAADGSAQARVPYSRTLRPPTVDGESLYLGTANLLPNHLGRNGDLVACGLDGDLEWYYQPDGSLQRPVVADGTVLTAPFATDSEPLAAFDADTGEPLWRRDTDPTPLLAVADDTLYVAPRDRVTALRD